MGISAVEGTMAQQAGDRCRAEGSPGNQEPNTAKSTHTDLHHLVCETRLALQEKMRLSLEQGGAELRIFSKEIL